MNNILVTGAKGQLGSELNELSKNYLDYNFFFTDFSELDISDFTAVKNFISENKINIIINCAAYTAVDKAESQIELADAINHLAVANFAILAKENNIKFVHISTDYVFDSTNNKPYKENCEPNPKSVYGETKLNGELAIQKIKPLNSIIIRTSWVYSKYGNNFVKTILRLADLKDQINVVSDQFGSPTNAADLAKTIMVILPKIDNFNVEIFHYSNEGVTNWYDFAKAISKISGKNLKINSILTEHYPTQAKRPSYSVLDKSKIKNKFDLIIPNWEKSLVKYFSKK